MTAAEWMMASMGYKEGTGLGKSKQGMVEPLALSTQRGRIGLGHGATKAVGRNFAETWDETVEEKTIEEKVEWIASSQEAREWSIRQIENCSWMELGPKKMTIADETEFCDGEILRQMIEAKDLFDVMSYRDLREARNFSLAPSYCSNRQLKYEWLFKNNRTFRRNVQTYLGSKISDKDVGLLGKDLYASASHDIHKSFHYGSEVIIRECNYQKDQLSLLEAICQTLNVRFKTV